MSKYNSLKMNELLLFPLGLFSLFFTCYFPIQKVKIDCKYLNFKYLQLPICFEGTNEVQKPNKQQILLLLTFQKRVNNRLVFLSTY